MTLFNMPTSDQSITLREKLWREWEFTKSQIFMIKAEFNNFHAIACKVFNEVNIVHCKFLNGRTPIDPLFDVAEHYMYHVWLENKIVRVFAVSY